MDPETPHTQPHPAAPRPVLGYGGDPHRYLWGEYAGVVLRVWWVLLVIIFPAGGLLVWFSCLGFCLATAYGFDGQPIGLLGGVLLAALLVGALRGWIRLYWALKSMRRQARRLLNGKSADLHRHILAALLAECGGYLVAIALGAVATLAHDFTWLWHALPPLALALVMSVSRVVLSRAQAGFRA